jgi:adenosyl cobinamide kinase/adenosyl cobinamide phosphate guanylyltransferase
MRERMQQNGNPEEEIIDFLNQNRECSIIIISDEIGNGIVPTDAFEREYRERTGRILVELASRADEVVRILCGIEQRIK